VTKMSNEQKHIQTPLTREAARALKAGDNVLITGTVYTARDAAHKKMVEALDKGEKLPFDPEGQIVYYVGPSPTKPGKVIGSAGPTTSYRMDAYSPRMIGVGISGMIGKGEVGKGVVEAMKKYGAVYFAAVGGAAALIARSIKKAEVIAYEDLGAEAVRKMEVENFPAIVAQDAHGGNLYVEGQAKYKKE
jgi:fumarate hydratase subunit beta